MTTPLKIAIADSSILILRGLESLLKGLSDFRIQFAVIPASDHLRDTLRGFQPDLLIANPSMPGVFPLQQLKEDTGCPDMRCIALVYGVIDPQWLRPFDEQISLYDSPDEIRHKLERLHLEDVPAETNGEEEVSALSSREKEIVVCVVKGMTNKEIAESLFLSTHTVITHRRNIARKLQIHSPSGLTIYAIVNKLVELSDIQQ